jgi:signal transduction histidine kinase/CheY-like chemotaxis protein
VPELALDLERRVLVLAPSGRDAPLTRELLENLGICCTVCTTVERLCTAIDEGAALALIVEEALTRHALMDLAETLSDQPAWSDFPLVIFSERTEDEAFSSDALRSLGNVTLLDRPVRVRTMLIAVQAALRSRARQYEARQAIAGRDRFLAMLGHELRNPLAAIRLALELERSNGLSKRWAVIDHRSRQLSRLVDDLLDVARVTSGKMHLQCAPLDLTAALRTSCESIEPSLGPARLALETSVQPDLHMVGDRARLEQVFGNLLTNALKYTPPGGRIRLEARAEGELIMIRVIDSGIGIDPSVQDKVFDLFAQADDGVSLAQGGLGLGLTVVRTLVELHGGKVRVHSEGKGHGTEVTVCLPIGSGAAEGSTEQPRSTPRAQRPQRLVVVEDNDDIRSMLRALLEQLGHEVFTANDGPDGVSRIQEVKPDLAFVDIGLPGFDGCEVARRVRTSLGNDVRLVAVTGYGQAADRLRAFDAGFEAHLTKPVGVEQVQSLLEAQLASGTDHSSLGSDS